MLKETLISTEVLFLSSNQLTGPVPGEIAYMRGKLRGLYLSDNQFEGDIPEALCKLEQLGMSFEMSDAQCCAKID